MSKPLWQVTYWTLYCHAYQWLYIGLGLLILFIDNSQVVPATTYNTHADSHTTNHSTLKLLSVLSLIFTIGFQATDLSQYHCNYNTCKVFDSYIKSSWHSLIPPIADSLNSDLRLSRSLLTQFLTTHYLIHFIFFFLHTPVEVLWLPNELSVIVGLSLYSLGSELTEICLRGEMFIEPLPSNRSIHQSVMDWICD
jgi:hypothetical protein